MLYSQVDHFVDMNEHARNRPEVCCTTKLIILWTYMNILDTGLRYVVEPDLNDLLKEKNNKKKF